MIGVIPNPKRTFQIEKSLPEVRDSIEHLPLFTNKYKLSKSNPTLSQFTFETSEFLSAGVWIDINCFSPAESRTDVTVEIRRKIGSFDKAHEVSLANTHLEKIAELISESVNAGQEKRTQMIENIKTANAAHVEAQNKKVLDANQKEADLKKNNPAWYYTKIALIYAATLGMLVIAGWLFYHAYLIVTK